MAPKNIVIVGGGHVSLSLVQIPSNPEFSFRTGGGAAVARALASKLKPAQSYTVKLINPLPYAISRPTLPRMTVSDHNDLMETALIPFDKLFPSGSAGSFVEGKVASIQANKEGGIVVLESGAQLPYDVLVLAPGSIWEGVLDIPDESKSAASAFITASRDNFKKAKKIVLAGGGAVGIELAGEIKDIWPAKEITIVHGEAQLMNKTYPASFRKGLEKRLHARGVKFIFDDYVDEIPPPGPAMIKTRKGEVIDADLVVPTRGPRPNTEFVAKSLGSDTLDERGHIKVKPTLQLVAHPSIFAIGDAILPIPTEQKQVMKTIAHGGVVTANVMAYLSGKPLKAYKGSGELITVTNGKDGGMAYLGGIVLGDWFARMVKSKGLLVSMSRSAMGY
ncbi:hypothetical protein B0H10DRAFT_1911283 [Mycena sp. CBHHK59/15]|nr:hypothetical protein B0H10DRAFT_1911283 [Mycena sp. CBHHK59/15]